MRIILTYIAMQSLMLGLDLNGISALKGWTMLQEGPVKIEWREYQGFPISRVEKIIDHDINSVAKIIQDLDRYPIIFERVTNTKRLDSNIVHIMLDMPFPFAGRDYIVQYSIEQSDSQWTFSFFSVEHPEGTLESGMVRLDNAAGLWVLKSLSDKQTLVTYAWNGELLGNFPDFGLHKAWVTQGSEVLKWLGEALAI
jgi:hypothetical protein